MHDTGTVHASGPNTHSERRIGFIMRSASRHACDISEIPRTSATLAGGEDRYGF